jgi:hypothetical protein
MAHLARTAWSAGAAGLTGVLIGWFAAREAGGGVPPVLWSR